MTARASKNAVDDRGLDTAYPLTADQVTSMHTKSWASLPGLLSREEVAKIRASLLAAPPRTHISGPNKTLADPEQLLSHEAVAWKDPYLQKVVTSRRLSSAVVGLLEQPDAIYVQDISFFKPIGASEIPYHQDFSYWPFDRQGCVTLWIALEDMSEEMGPLRYLAGSHRAGPLGLIEQRDIREAYPHLRELESVGGKPLKAGDAQAHWELTLHGSAANTGNARREAVAFRYHRSDVVYTGLWHPHYSTFDLTPGKKFTECKDFWRVGPNGAIGD
ncbi:MAG: phytanoyl-CoA dioxygenase family protein [Labilithrix sp.]|nr:phytanoyl-CoA dioxygenase family protein [Labilithrix sp.]